MAHAPQVLVVEDEPSIRELLREILELEGYEVELAADGLEALEKLERARPALVVTGLAMPRMDGLALIGELRRGVCPAVRIVALGVDPKRREQAGRLGADAVLAKPFEIDTFVHAVRSLAPPGEH